MWETLTDEVDCAAYIDVHYEIKVGEVKGCTIAVDDLWDIGSVSKLIDGRDNNDRFQY